MKNVYISQQKRTSFLRTLTGGFLRLWNHQNHTMIVIKQTENFKSCAGAQPGIL